MNVCKFCGTGQQGEDTLGYQCASWRYRGSDIWIQSAVCQQRSLQLRLHYEQTIEVLERRMATAIEAAEQASRFDIIAERDGTIIAQPDSTGCYAWASVLDDIAGILQGNSPEIPEGSP